MSAPSEYLVKQIEGLPLPEQQVMQMYYIDLLKMGEIVAITGKTEGEVKGIIDSAITMLRQALRPKEGN